MMGSSSSRILVIDDDDVDRENVIRFLEELNCNFSIDTAVSGKTARALFSDNHYDCVILDYRLPDATGIEVLNGLLVPDKPPFCGLVMLTGEGDETTAVEAMKAGIHDYLAKESLTAVELFRSFQIATKAAKQAEQNYYQRQALENFAGMVAHDLITPLNGVIGFQELAISQYKDQLPEQLLDYLHDSLSSGRYMEKLVRGLLNYARTGASSEELAKVPLEEIVGRAIHILESEVEDKRASIRYPDLPDIYVREYEFIQLFQNLLGNALKYSGDKAPQIRIEATLEDYSVLIKVQDNGVGIAADKLDKIFAPLQRATDSGLSGLGLGLATCAKIVEAHDGKIWCEAEIGKGSSFYISLPHPPANR